MKGSEKWGGALELVAQATTSLVAHRVHRGVGERLRLLRRRPLGRTQDLPTFKAAKSTGGSTGGGVREGASHAPPPFRRLAALFVQLDLGTRALLVN